MKLATYNIQNIFFRHKSLKDSSRSRNFSNWLKEMDELMNKSLKTGCDQERLRELSFLVGFENIDRQGFAVMRRRGGNFFISGIRFAKEMHAAPYNNWNGWIEIENQPISFVKTENKARVVSSVNPDVLVLQEVEGIEGLRQFNKTLLPQVQCHPYEHQLLIHGNEERGQDLGLLTRGGHDIRNVRSHHTIRDAKNQPLFERNLLEYELIVPSGETVVVLSVHFTEGGADEEKSDAKREEQSKFVAARYEALLSSGSQNIIVCGTFNAVSYCYSLSPLLRDTSLKEVSRHPGFSVISDEGKDAGYFSLGAYGKGINLKQKDYLLVSPGLFKRIKSAGMNRKGVWPQRNHQWPIYPQIRSVRDAASEHPALWVDLDI